MEKKYSIDSVFTDMEISMGIGKKEVLSSRHGFEKGDTVATLDFACGYCVDVELGENSGDFLTYAFRQDGAGDYFLMQAYDTLTEAIKAFDDKDWHYISEQLGEWDASESVSVTVSGKRGIIVDQVLFENIGRITDISAEMGDGYSSFPVTVNTSGKTTYVDIPFGNKNLLESYVIDFHLAKSLFHEQLKIAPLLTLISAFEEMGKETHVQEEAVLRVYNSMDAEREAS